VTAAQAEVASAVLAKEVAAFPLQKYKKGSLFEFVLWLGVCINIERKEKGELVRDRRSG